MIKWLTEKYSGTTESCKHQSQRNREGNREREGSYIVVNTYTLVEQHFHYKHTREYYQKTSSKQSKLIIHLQYFFKALHKHIVFLGV